METGVAPLPQYNSRCGDHPEPAMALNRPRRAAAQDDSNGRTTSSSHETARDREFPSLAGPPPGGRNDDSYSSLVKAYQKAEPYMAASSTLVASVVAFTALGYWLDHKMSHSVQWLLIVGSVVGMAIGFVSFFRKVLRSGRAR